MEKITTVEQLQNLCCQQQEKNQTDKVSILVCGGTGCQSSNSQQIIENLRAALAEHGLQDMVEVVRTGCFGFCEKGPIVKILPDNTFYTQVKPEDAAEIGTKRILLVMKRFTVCCMWIPRPTNIFQTPNIWTFIRSSRE